MPNIVNIKLRDDTHDKAPVPRFIPGYYEDVNLDELTPRARTLAEAVAQSDLRTATDIWMESDAPIRDRVQDWQHWYTEEQAIQHERRPWRGWAWYPADSSMTAVEYLEREARKIPPGWHVIGAHPSTPVPSVATGAEDRYLTRDQVLAYMRGRGRDISASTWSAYTSRKRAQAPVPDRYVGRTPQWKVETIDAFLDGTWRGAAA